MLVWIQNPFDNLPEEGYRSQRYRLMAEAFVRAGHQVVYWTSDFSHANKRARDFSLTGKCPGVSLRLIPTRPYVRNVSLARVLSHRAYAREWLRQALKESGRPALVLSSVPTLSGAAAALAIGRHFGARTVLDVQDAWPETFERILPRWVLTPLRLKARRLYRAAGRVTGVCDRYRELVGREDYLRAYLGLELPPPVDRTQSPPGAPVRLIYLGGTGKTYDLKTVIAAVEANADFELDIAGPGSLVSPNSRVRFHGYLPHARLQGLMARADVGVIPMADDSFVGLPNKLFDYAAAGLPVVSSLTGECAVLLDRYDCGCRYPAGDVGALAAAIRRALTLPPGASRKLADAEFDARQIYDRYVAEITHD